MKSYQYKNPRHSKFFFSLVGGGDGKLTFRTEILNNTEYKIRVKGLFKPKTGLEYVVKSCSYVRACSVLCQRHKGARIKRRTLIRQQNMTNMETKKIWKTCIALPCWHLDY